MFIKYKYYNYEVIFRVEHDGNIFFKSFLLIPPPLKY